MAEIRKRAPGAGRKPLPEQKRRARLVLYVTPEEKLAIEKTLRQLREAKE